MKISNFKNFKINEKVGVAEPTLFYVDPILNKVWNEFLEFYQSDEKRQEESYNISYNTIRPNITDRFTYSQFPVVGIELDVVFYKMTDQEFNKKYRYSMKSRKGGVTHKIGGAAVSFGHKNWAGYTRMAPPVKEVSDHGLIIHCGIYIDLSSNFNMGIYKNKIQEEIEETIWHELNHLYEYYNRALVQVGRIEKRGPSLAVTYADVNKWGIPREIYEYWTYEFAYYIYASEQHELNAQVQEAAFWINKHGISKLQKTQAWENAEYMESFDADDFIEGLDNEIFTYIESKQKPEEIAKREDSHTAIIKERLKNMWVQQYEKALLEGETPFLPLNAMKKMDCDEFISYFQRRLNKSGRYLKSKLGKLYEMDPNKE